MRINSVQSYSMIAKSNSVYRNNVSSDMTFGYKKHFSTIFYNNANTKFALNESKINYNKMNHIYTRLMNALSVFPDKSKTPDFKQINRGMKAVTADDLKEVARRLNLAPGEGRNVVTYKGFDYLRVQNLGPYSTGWFSTTPHDQVVIEFRDPCSENFIGFSLDKEGGVAVTRLGKREEFYDLPKEKRLKAVGRNYLAESYTEVYDIDGKPATPSSSFWDIFK